jgi:pimeloyl-ACP methyl ester carboxylesterase|tara:strand:+ start:11090 stop:12016 length:927 start_codon:yes stop_codon:yes gene_type:complete
MKNILFNYNASRQDVIEVRGLKTSLRRWGPEDAPVLLLLHGIRDCSATFQFIVDHLQAGWQAISPDWRGHGHTERAQTYWFHDFVGDLSTIVDMLSPNFPIPIIGHSLGGNIAGIYAGLRPSRVSHLISLDGFGPLVNEIPVDPRKVMRDFLDETNSSRHKIYPDVQAMADRLSVSNPRLSQQNALYLAENSSKPSTNGGRHWLYAPQIRVSLPSFRNFDEWGRIWSDVICPTLWIQSGDKRPNAPTNNPSEMRRRAEMMPPGLVRITLDDTGHNLHHDAAEKIGSLVSKFLERPALVSNKFTIEKGC